MVELALAMLGIGVLMVLILPVLLIVGVLAAILKLAFFIVLLPFQILFYGLAGLFHVAGAVAKVTVGFFAFLLMLAAAAVFAVLLIPALPLGVLLIAAGLAWVGARLLGRSRRDAAQA